MSLEARERRIRGLPESLFVLLFFGGAGAGLLGLNEWAMRKQEPTPNVTDFIESGKLKIVNLGEKSTLVETPFGKGLGKQDAQDVLRKLLGKMEAQGRVPGEVLAIRHGETTTGWLIKY